jgi:arginine utilization protein RocB
MALRLARFESITDGPGEEAFGPFLAEILRASPAFAGAKERVRLLATIDDSRKRSIVVGFVRGSGRKTVLLTGHYDVVGVQAYGRLRDLAFDPERLTSALLKELRSSREEALASGRQPAPAEELARSDLEGGDFLAGRGLLDMKAGLAAGIAVLEDFAADPTRAGNLLFMAVPDEEGASHGMRSAVRLLPALLAEWGLELRLAINLDSAVDQGDGRSARGLSRLGRQDPALRIVPRPS